MNEQIEISKDKYYCGWMDADLDEYDTLLAMGVFGPMVYEDLSVNNSRKSILRKPKEGTISFCYCTGAVLLELEERYHSWWKENYVHYEYGIRYPVSHFSEIGADELMRCRSNGYDGGVDEQLGTL